MSLISFIPVLGKVIDKIFPDKEAASAAKLRLLELQQSGELKELETSASIIRAEANGDGMIQRNWRPITMLTFVGLIVAHWLGFTAENLSQEEILGILDIVKLGLGGYVLGRSGEKIAKVWKENDENKRR